VTPQAVRDAKKKQAHEQETKAEDSTNIDK